MDKNGVDVIQRRVVVEVGLKLLMQLVSSLSAAVLASGNKVFAEDGTIAVDDDKRKRGRFLDTSAPDFGAGLDWACGRTGTYSSRFKNIQLSLLHALLLLPYHGVALLAIALGALVAVTLQQVHVAHSEVVFDAAPFVHHALPRLKGGEVALGGIDALGCVEAVHGGGVFKVLINGGDVVHVG